jgi:dienelactone hydrolase
MELTEMISAFMKTLPAASRAALGLFLWAMLVNVTMPSRSSAQSIDAPEMVTFASLDRRTTLVGYLFRPRAAAAATPAIVMMHGRAGPYSTLAGGRYDETTLSKRHLDWGRRWADLGITALLVDGFGPRGFPKGFPIHSYSWRPNAVDEIYVRPGDAYSALAFLAQRPGIDSQRIALQGWSNGGSATLAAMNEDIRAQFDPGRGLMFKAAVAFYPACEMHRHFELGYTAYAPVRVYSGSADEEVSALRCQRLIERAADAGIDAAIAVFDGATHGFDDPGLKRQRVFANRAARDEAITAATSFILEELRR